MLVPIVVFLGLPIKEAIASALVSVLATSSGSASAHVKDRLANIKIAMYLEMFTRVGAIIPATITTLIPPCVAPTFVFALWSCYCADAL